MASVTVRRPFDVEINRENAATTGSGRVYRTPQIAHVHVQELIRQNCISVKSELAAVAEKDQKDITPRGLNLDCT